MKKLPYQSARESRRRTHVADFDTLPALLHHAQNVDGATHVLVRGRTITVYYPRTDGQYSAGELWQDRGYWHAPAASDRKVVAGLPAGAESIGSHARRAGRRTAEHPVYSPRYRPRSRQ